MNFLKVVYDGQLVDEEAVASLEPKSLAPIEDTHSRGVAMEGGEYGVPQL